MTRGFAVRLLLSALVLASVVIVALHALGLWSAGIVPVQVQQRSDGPYVVFPVTDVPLPPPLVDGDVLVPEAMTPAARAAVNYSLGVQQGSSIGLAVLRGGHVMRTSVRAQYAPSSGPTWLNGIVGAFLITPFLALLGLLTLWRGRDRVAAGLCGVSLYALIAGALLSLSQSLAEPLATVWLVLVLVEGQYVVAVPSLYVMAEALVEGGLSVRARTLSRVVVACIAVSALGLDLAGEISFTYYGSVLPPIVGSLRNALIVAFMAVPVLLLLTGYRRAPHGSRLRIRWVLWSTAFLLVCVLAGLAVAPIQSRHPYLFQFTNTVRWFAFAGYLYAAIRTRLVDVSFVVNRALVYAGITGLLFGIFSLLELGLHELAVGDKLSWVLQAVAALLLAVAMSPLHRRLEHWVERFLFRKQRLAIEKLRIFAAECAFIEQQTRLLETAVERLHPHCDGVAIYERALSGYQLRGSMGRTWPETVDVDDPAFVSLRAHREEVDLHGSSSAIGSDSMAFPMTVGEMLSGAVVCRPRSGERFAPDIRAALAEIARNLGASLYILRYREQARLVADIAAGRIDETGARRRAIAMLEGAAA